MSKPKRPEGVTEATRALLSWIETGEGQPETEFLGDVYQYHSVEAREKRNLIQTPGFVRAFILDRTLKPVIEQLGPVAVKLMDPACGPGHFLVDAFRRTLAAWRALPEGEVLALLERAGGAPPPNQLQAELAQVVLDQVWGVDLDPVCVAIARTRLLFEAWAAGGVRMPFRLRVYEGDSLLHARPQAGDEERFGPWSYDVEAVRRALAPGQYTAVVANPPYGTGDDRALRHAYRERWKSAAKKFSLGVPFTELCFELAVRGRDVVREEQGVLFAGLCVEGGP